MKYRFLKNYLITNFLFLVQNCYSRYFSNVSIIRVVEVEEIIILRIKMKNYYS